MHKYLKVSIALLVLSIRMWNKLSFIRYIVPESIDDLDKINPLQIVFGFALLYLIYYLFNKTIAPFFWRANIMHNGVYLTNNWVPVIGQINVMNNLKQA